MTGTFVGFGIDYIHQEYFKDDLVRQRHFKYKTQISQINAETEDSSAEIRVICVS